MSENEPKSDSIEEERRFELRQFIEADLDSWFDETHIIRGED